MVIFFHTSVESCGGDYGISSREEGVWPSSSKRERSMTMAIFLPALVKSCGGGHGIYSSERGSALPIPEKKGRMTMATFLLSSVGFEKVAMAYAIIF